MKPVADKGAMIQLRIDQTRITQPAPLCLETGIAGDEHIAGIVAPNDDEFEPIGLWLQGALAERTGIELPLVDEAEFAGIDELPAHMIAIGHAANNRLLRWLHAMAYLGNADYPRAGHRLMSVHNVLGDGHNVLACLGRDADVARRGARRLVEQVVQRESQWLVPGRLLDTDPVPEAPDPEEFLAALESKDPSSSGGRPSGMLTALGHVNATGSESWGRAFIRAVMPYATGEVPLSFWLMSAVDFWTDRLAIAWDMAEEFPFFLEEERLLMANFIASCTEYCHDSITYQKWRITKDEHQVFNHHTFPARGLFFGCMYLRRHGYEVVDIDHWLGKALRVFSRAAEAGRSFDEGGAGYSWLVGNHLMQVSLACGDIGYVTSDRLLRYADLATTIQNNSFELVPFGDCGGYHGGAGGAAEILLRAAEWHNDPGCKWVAEQCAPQVAEADVMAAGVQGAPPEKHVGLFVLPMDPVVHRWTGLPRFPGYPPPPCIINVPPEKGFDKISFRGAWEPDADYLLLQGFGEGQHGHPDANAISQYQVRGRLFLAESDYIRRMPKQHNMVMCIRDGRHGPIPVTARLHTAVSFRDGAVTQTSLSDYNGCDWLRTIIWLSGDCLLVVDQLTACIDGDYELRCYWRTLGQVEPTERGLCADHAGERFHIIQATDAQQRLDAEPPPLNATDYPEYRYGPAVPHVLCQSCRQFLYAGEQASFANLLLPNGQEVEPRRHVRRLDDGRLFITGDGPMITIAAEGFQIEDSGSFAFDHGARLTALASHSRPTLSPPSHLPRPAAAKDWSALLPAPAACMTPAGDVGTLIGCENGSIVLLDDAGAVRPLGQAEDRVGAVLAAELYGEAETTYLAAGYDQRLRMLTPSGEDRLLVDLPRNSHMPAWGRALCAADLDGSGRLTPLVGTAAWRVHAVEPDGNFRWTFDTAAHSVTGLATGDLNGDGRDETAVATVYFCVPAISADGERLWQDEDYNDYWTAGPTFPFVRIADVDLDGSPEVITAGSDTLVHCIDSLGEKMWTRSIGDDPMGLEIVKQGIAAASLTGTLHLIDGLGAEVWRLDLDAPCRALASAGELLCIVDEQGLLVWVDAAGSPVRSLQLRSAACALLGRPDGSVVVALPDGTALLARP